VNLFQPTATTDQVMPLVEMQLEQVLSPHTKKYRKRAAFRSTSAATRAATTGSKNEHQAGQNATNHDQKTENQFHRYTTIQVNQIMVSVTSSVLLAQQQRQLFDQNPRLDRQSLAHLINRLSNRLGTQNVVYPSLQSGAQPEYSFRLRPLVDPRRKRRRRKTQPPKQSHLLARPFRLFHPPLRLKKGDRSLFCSDFKRQTPKKGPVPFFISQIESNRGPLQPQEIVASWGPERIETGWWRGRTVCRDYWRVETATHQQLWIFHDLRNDQWFLHGEF